MKKPVKKKRATKSAPPTNGSADTPPPHSEDSLSPHAQEVNALVAMMPFNKTKPAEYGHHNGLDPIAGQTADPPSASTTASSASEPNSSPKTGAPQAPGASAMDGTLERVRVDSGGQMLTTNQGVPIADNQHSLKAGLRGPALLEDFILREKITHFDHERIPERIVHARGSAAHGFFEAYKPLTKLTRAAPFAEAGKQTPVFVRFSTVAGERGSKDTARDIRGFAVKFYSDEGNWDLVGNNIPVFFIQDAMKFPDLVHAVKPEPHHGMPQAASAHDTFWDFVSLMPESTHVLLWKMSDRAIPRSYRMMQGFGVHTFRLVNATGESQFVKFHWTPLLGTHALTWDEAVKISGADPDYHRRDLWDAIESGEFPEWELGLQVFSEADAEGFSFDVLDSTKIIPEELVPVVPVGRMVLNRNPDNFFAETEQVAFCTAHIIPGIDFTNDPLLGGRIHSYVDTQISRLGGPNFHEIPINAPMVPVHNNQRDGLHRQSVNRGRVAYEPNSLNGGCPFQAGATGFVSFPQPVDQDKVRGNPEKFAEHYLQARLFFDSQTEVEQNHIIGAFRFELSKVTVPAIRQRMLSSLRNVSDVLAEAVATGLGMPLPAVMPRAMESPPVPEIDVSPPLSMTSMPGNGGIRTRKIAVLVADGVSGAAVNATVAALLAQGAVPRFVGKRLGPVATAEEGELEAEASMENSPAVLFDAMVLPAEEEAVMSLLEDGRILEFVKDQYRHCKTILVGSASADLIERCGIPMLLPSGDADPGLVSDLQTFIKAVGLHRHFERDRDPPLV